MQTVKMYDQPMVSDTQNPPTTIRVMVPVRNEIVGGVPSASHKPMTYVLYDVLPEDLKRRVQTAIEALRGF